MLPAVVGADLITGRVRPVGGRIEIVVFLLAPDIRVERPAAGTVEAVVEVLVIVDVDPERDLVSVRQGTTFCL
jgi:hypothetical protein